MRFPSCICRSGVGGIVCLLALSLVSCSSSDPAGPDTIVEDLFIGGVYRHFPEGGPSRSVAGAFVVVRDGSQTGPVVGDLAVRINGHQLSFDQSIGYYVGVAPSLASGDDVTISVSDGLGSVSQTVQVPYAPSDFRLDGDVWDTSSSYAANTLRWDNPMITAQTLSLFIYDHDGDDITQVWAGEAPNANTTSLTIYNYALSYYDLTSAMAVVGQTNYSYFNDNPDQSAVVVLASDWGEWPVSD